MSDFVALNGVSHSYGGAGGRLAIASSTSCASKMWGLLLI